MNFAVIEGEDIINIIVADSLQDAEQVAGKKCVQYSEKDVAEPGGKYKNKKFIPRKPFESWILDSNNQWKAPVPYPNDELFYLWSEADLEWKLQPTVYEEEPTLPTE